MEKVYIKVHKSISRDLPEVGCNTAIEGDLCTKDLKTGDYTTVRRQVPGRARRQNATVCVACNYYRQLRAGEVIEAEVEQADDDVLHCTRIDLAPVDSAQKVQRYLVSATLSSRTAKAIVNHYGNNALTAILDDEHAYDAFGVSEKAVTKIRNRLLDDMAYRTLQDLLRQRGAPCAVAPDLYHTYQDEVVDVVTNTPYRAYVDELLPFAVADNLFLAAGHSAIDPIRCQMAVREVLMRAVNNGSVYWPRDKLIKRTNYLVSDFDCKEIDACINRMAADGTLVCDGADGSDVYPPNWYQSECKAAEHIAAIERTPKKPPICTPLDIKDFFASYLLDNGAKLSPEQVMAVQTSLTSPASIITGDPGCGKTVVIQALVAIIKHYAPYATIRVCAPTGKSARNVADVTQLDATTIHSFVLQAERLNLDDGCHCDYLIVDEISMVDIKLLEQLLQVMAKTCRLILVGDAGQILSIGPGLVLGQMITSGQIVIETLHQVYRQAAGSKIKELANDIKRGVLASDYRSPGKEVVIPRVGKDAAEPSTIGAVVDRLLAQGTAPQDIQILTPRRGGDVGVQAINNQVRTSLNLHKTTSAAPGLQVGDRVVQTINRYNKPEGTIYNGTTGYVTAVGKDGAVTVDFGASGCFSYSKKELSDLELAYAMTIHKAQGSGFGTVVLALGARPDPLLTRQVLYTAVTRAAKQLIIIAGKDVLEQAVKHDATYNRYSNLDKRLRELLSPTWAA